ncbi:MAG: ABC transporter ATP-binding protein [Rikenellaceae bacterium]
MRLIALKGLEASYDGQQVLRNVDLEIHSDDFIAIIGPNGGGKTTLVKAILGLIETRGQKEYSPALRHGKELLIGYMPQINQFDKGFPITIEEVVLSGLLNRRRWRTHYNAAERQRCAELLAQTGITKVAHHQIGEVSGGQLQRALLCRAIIAEPKLLILDEPTNYVDSRFEGEMYAILRSLNERMAIIMVSHDIGTVSSFVKQIVCVNGTVHRHESNIISEEQLLDYNCPIKIITHGKVPHTVLSLHENCNCK